jgi:triosephosphate isomerase
MNKTTSETKSTLEDLVERAKELSDKVEMAICPPFTSLETAGPILNDSKVKLGAQNFYPEPAGAYTGEVSAPMLKNLGCQYVIVGHSERRGYFHEDNAFVGRKVRVALDNGLSPIICVGENLDEREAGRGEAVVVEELQVLATIPPAEAARVVIAYEPIWAIGTGRAASGAMAEEMCAAIRRTLSQFWGERANDVRILYGGSVKADNMKEYAGQPDIDGALVGGASLSAPDFVRIIGATGEAK